MKNIAEVKSDISPEQGGQAKVDHKKKERLSIAPEGERFRYSNKFSRSDLIQITIGMIMLFSVIATWHSVMAQKAATENIQMLYTAQLRPFVYAIAEKEQANMSSNGRFEFSYSLRNSGNTPAYEVRLTSSLTTSAQFPALDFSLGEEDILLTDSLDIGLSIYPNETNLMVVKYDEISVNNPDYSFTVEDLRRIMPIYMHIEVQYKDQFDNPYCYKGTYLSRGVTGEGEIVWERLFSFPDVFDEDI